MTMKIMETKDFLYQYACLLYIILYLSEIIRYYMYNCNIIWIIISNMEQINN
ncbi:MAG: hypothetical protein HeimC2_23050 [Candidatus Heimdallarchaeota archaeon LC_2]|nr:MAG: hypothetical protein HeimC2_23050 [Candidatus Heimdallarchaeota archaeon LC_2]